MLRIIALPQHGHLDIDTVIDAMITHCNFVLSATNPDPYNGNNTLHRELFTDSTKTGDLSDGIIELTTYFDGHPLIARHDSDPADVKLNWLDAKDAKEKSAIQAALISTARDTCTLMGALKELITVMRNDQQAQGS